MKKLTITGLLVIATVLLQFCSQSSQNSDNKEIVNSSEEKVIREVPSVIMYGSNACVHCINFKTKLDSVGVGYVFYDVDVDDEKVKEMVQLVKEHNFKGRIRFPVVLIGESDLFIAPKFGDVLELLTK